MPFTKPKDAALPHQLPPPRPSARVPNWVPNWPDSTGPSRTGWTVGRTEPHQMDCVGLPGRHCRAVNPQVPGSSPGGRTTNGDLLPVVSNTHRHCCIEPTHRSSWSPAASPCLSKTTESFEDHRVFRRPLKEPEIPCQGVSLRRVWRRRFGPMT